MHELPDELNSSLRSFRGSIYGRSIRRVADDDLEKGPADYGAKDYSRAALSPGPSSLVIHPTHSYHALRQQAEAQDAAHFARAQQGDSSQAQTGPAQQTVHGTEIAGPKRHTTFDHPKTPQSTKHSIFRGPKIEDPDPASDRLTQDNTPLTHEEFYELMGMAPLEGNKFPKKLGAQHGLYATIHSSFEWTQWKYRIFDVATYVFLGLQILLSAVFIVLGSLTQVHSHIAIAVLGAVSTVIAGTLALMKGQGLPNRLRQVRDDLRNVLFEAEELYWDVAAKRLVYFSDVKKIREDYLRVMEEARKNHPDTWNRETTIVARGVEHRTAVSGEAVIHSSK